MRNVILVLFLSIYSVGFAQEFHASKDPATSLSQIQSFTKDVKTFESKFVQTKEIAMMSKDLKSSGSLAYSEDAGMRWEYMEPNPSVLVMADDKTVLKDETGIRDLASTNAIMKRVEKMVASCLDGSILSDGNYKTNLYEKAGFIKAELFPKQRRMKEMASAIEIVFDTSKGVLTSLALVDATGDKTIIAFSNPVANGKLEVGLFKLE